MAEVQHIASSIPPPHPPPPSSSAPAPAPPHMSLQPITPPRFNPSRMIGVIRREGLVKDLAAVYHAECLTYCHELSQLESKLVEPFADKNSQDGRRKEQTRTQKRLKKV